MIAPDSHGRAEEVKGEYGIGGGEGEYGISGGELIRPLDMYKIDSFKVFYLFIQGLFLLYKLANWLYNKNKPWMNK